MTTRLRDNASTPLKSTYRRHNDRHPLSGTAQAYLKRTDSSYNGALAGIAPALDPLKLPWLISVASVRRMFAVLFVARRDLRCRD